jgi:hypothetical protein
MQEQAAQPHGWIQRHWVVSLIFLIVLPVAILTSIGVGVLWAVNTANLARFGPPPPAGQDCGSIVHSEAPPERTARADADIQAFTCFWNAYRPCQAATLSQTEAATDAGGTDTLTIERRGNRCAIYGHEEDYANTNHTTKTFLCNQLNQQGDALQVSGCDGHDPFTLDARFIKVYISRSPIFISETYSCGVIGDAHLHSTPQQIESCFFTAYNQCLADSMVYDTLEPRVEVQKAFYIDNHCAIGYQRGQYMTTCASLEFQADGLHFVQCGTDGDIFVPSAMQS